MWVLHSPCLRGGGGIKRDAKRQRGATLTFFQGMWAGVGVTPNVNVSLHSPCLRGWGQEFSVSLSVSVGLHSPFLQGMGAGVGVTPNVSVRLHSPCLKGWCGVKHDAQRQYGGFTHLV